MWWAKLRGEGLLISQNKYHVTLTRSKLQNSFSIMLVGKDSASPANPCGRQCLSRQTQIYNRWKRNDPSAKEAPQSAVQMAPLCIN